MSETKLAVTAQSLEDSSCEYPYLTEVAERSAINEDDLCEMVKKLPEDNEVIRKEILRILVQRYEEAYENYFSSMN